MNFVWSCEEKDQNNKKRIQGSFDVIVDWICEEREFLQRKRGVCALLERDEKSMEISCTLIFVKKNG